MNRSNHPMRGGVAHGGLRVKGGPGSRAIRFARVRAWWAAVRRRMDLLLAVGAALAVVFRAGLALMRSVGRVRRAVVQLFGRGA